MKLYWITITKLDPTTRERSIALPAQAVFADDEIGAAQKASALLNGNFDPTTMRTRIIQFQTIGN